MNTYLPFYLLRPTVQKATLIGATALLLGSFDATAQVLSKTQDFSGTTAGAAAPTTYVNLSTAADATTPTAAGYFTANFTKPTATDGPAAFGVEDNNVNATTNSIPVVFEGQVFQKSSNNNLTFQLGQKGRFGFSDQNSVAVDVSLNGGAAVRVLTMNGPFSNGPQFNIGTGGTVTASYASPQTITMGLNAIGNYTITLPDFTTRTRVNVTITVAASKKSTVLIDNVTIASGAPLPVELTRFSATTKSQSVGLSWATASEKNNDRFEVQRSVTGTEFQTIGSVKGQGSTSNAHEYTFEDSRPLPGLLYYRLRQVDSDGTGVYSPVATARVQLAPIATAYPNPSANTLTLPTLVGPVGYRIFNSLGQTLLSGQSVGDAQLDLSQLAKGSFFLEITTESGRAIQRLVRE